jgi:hypothetical protein
VTRIIPLPESPQHPAHSRINKVRISPFDSPTANRAGRLYSSRGFSEIAASRIRFSARFDFPRLLSENNGRRRFIDPEKVVSWHAEKRVQMWYV